MKTMIKETESRETRDETERRERSNTIRVSPSTYQGLNISECLHLPGGLHANSRYMDIGRARITIVAGCLHPPGGVIDRWQVLSGQSADVAVIVIESRVRIRA